MASRRTTPYEGVEPDFRHRSPSFDNPHYYNESLRHGSSVVSAGTSRTRRRPSRTGSSDKVSPQSASPPCGDGSRETSTRSKASRNTLKKLPRRDSLYSDTSYGGQGSYDNELETSYIPRLGQIREAKESRTLDTRAMSTVSSTSGPRGLRRRHTDDSTASRTRTRHKHGSLRRGSEGLDKLSNPSLNSVISESTQQSASSGRSNTTAIDISVAGQSHVGESESSSTMDDSGDSDAPTDIAPTETRHTQSNVFQFMDEEDEDEDEDEHSVRGNGQMAHPRSASPSAASSSGSEHSDIESSNADSSQVQGTPTTSPASTRRSDMNQSTRRSRGQHPPTPLYASSFVHGHGGHGGHGGQGDEPDDSEEESDDHSDDHSDGDGDGYEVEEMSEHAEDDNAHRFALERAPPPRAPAASPPPNDSHSRRLRQQEQELVNHVLQSPQPQKDFQFAGGPFPPTHPSMPLYSPRAYVNPAPAVSGPPGGHSSEWPAYPPPLPIGYSSQAPLESPTHTMPLTVQPPMGVAGLQGQQASPHHQYPEQPPHYQPNVPRLDTSRTTFAGYELLANKLSEPFKANKSHKNGNIVPMYRKFEHLNHRVLLHLQDETCELEEELRYLDECIIQASPKDDAGQAYPASRRGDAEYGSELHFRRTELLGRIFQKLGQYNEALTSFNNLIRNLDPATPDDIQAYRTWMERRVPIDDAETRFLERRNDLVAVSRKSSVVGVSTSAPPGAGHHQSSVVWLPLVLVLPLIAFAIVPSLHGRLIVIALICAVELRLVTTTPELGGLMAMRNWMAAGSVYFGLMALLAGLVR